MRIIIADNKKLEKHNLVEKTIRGFTLPLLNNIPSSVVKKVLAGTNKDGKVVIKKGGSARSLEVLYTRHDRKLFSRGIFQGIHRSKHHYYM